MSGSSSGTMSLVNLESSNVVQTFANGQSGVGIRLVSVLRNDASFVFVDEANKVEFRNFDNGAGLVLGQPAAKVTSVTPLGLNHILFGCENGELLLLDYFEGINNEYKHQAHNEAVTQVKSHPSNDFLYFASGSASGSVKLWYVTKTVPPVWSQMWSHDNVHQHPITALTFVPHSEDVVSGSYGNEVCYVIVCCTCNEKSGTNCYYLVTTRLINRLATGCSNKSDIVCTYNLLRTACINLVGTTCSKSVSVINLVTR